MNQRFGAKLRATKARVTKEFTRRLWRVWGSELAAGQAVWAYNGWTAPVLRYYQGVIRWARWDMRQLDRTVRRVMKANGRHCYGASIRKLYPPRSEGGRGLHSMELMWEREVVGVAAYLARSQDDQVKESG